jgi:uncharacterized protein YkwD/uncharacterized protein YjdB
LISAVLSIAIILSALSGWALASKTPSDWAKQEMSDANIAGLLTANSSKDFHRSLTRDEFCELVVLMTEKILGKELPVPVTNPFTDSTSKYVQKAFAYGIVNGVDDNRFAPNNSVKRQELVAMMIRAITHIQSDIYKTLLKSPTGSPPFNDLHTVSEYALIPLATAYTNGIVKGDDLNNFNPLKDVTSQECVAVVVRSYKSMLAIVAASLTSQQLLAREAENLVIGYAFGDAPGGVTQNLLLPTTTLAGANVSWSSSSPAVISATGVVDASRSLPVTLTATIYAGGYTTTKTFSLYTSTYRNDQLLISNAYNELEISFYNKDDSLDSVTGRVFLPTTILSANVTWSSSSTAVVAVDGTVRVPSNDTTQTVTLWAQIQAGSESVTKTFTLRVRNPLYATSAFSLHSVELGMTAAQVNSVLGAYKMTLDVASGESWSIFYGTGYTTFIAVAYRSGKVAGVYSMASTWASQLRDVSSKTVVTPAQVNTKTGVSATVYTDSVTGKQYAVFLADTTSGVTTLRNFTPDGVEQLMTYLVNAYRVYNSRAAIESTPRLAASARAHSADMGTNSYFSETGRTGSTFSTRAAAQSYPANLVLSGSISHDNINAFDFLDDVIKTTSYRTGLLSASASVAGFGYAGNYSGIYKNLFTFVFGNLTAIGNVTSSPASVTVGVNASTLVTLNVTPSPRDETFTVTSSNTAYLTVSVSGTNANAVTVTGRVAGTANIVVTGAISGKQFTIPVSIGNVYATNLLIRNEANNIIANNVTSSTIATYGYILGVGTTYAFTATPYPANSGAVTWTSTNPSIASVTAAGLVTAAYSGSTTITARVQKSVSESIIVTINVTVVPAIGITPNVAASTIDLASPTLLVTVTTPAATNPVTGVTFSGYTWTSSSPTYATVSPATGQVATITGQAATPANTPAKITVTANYSLAANYNYYTKIEKSINVTVTGSAAWPSSATASDSNLSVALGETKRVTFTTVPANAQNKIISFTYTGTDFEIRQVSPTEYDITGKAITAAPVRVEARVRQSANENDVYLVPVNISVTKITLGATVASNAPAGGIVVGTGGPYTCSFIISPAQAASIGGFTTTWMSSNPLYAINPSTGVITIDPSAVSGYATFYLRIDISDTNSYGNTQLSFMSDPINVVVTVPGVSPIV